MEIPKLHSLFLKSEGVSTDTRKINKSSIFFALRGEKFNANEFAQQALNNGATYAVVDEEKYASASNHILVKDVLTSLQQLANYHRNYLKLPILALTGSNGKTTTKELINSVLKKKYNTTATSGNLNNHIGVPLTLLSMTKDTEFGIVEMGANHHGEIANLCQIAEPDYGYITNFGKAHLEGFGSLEGVKKAKGELYDFLKLKNGLIFINADDETQKKQLSYNKVYSFGTNANVDIQYKTAAPSPFLQLQFENLIINSKLIGTYNTSNLAAALAIGRFFKIKKEDIANAISNYEPSNNRSQIIKRGSNTIILDAYNANPTSMQAALESFESTKAENKTVILGDMFEMGAAAEEEHQNIISILEKMKIKEAFVIGENFSKTKIVDPKIKQVRNTEELKEVFDFSNLENTIILIKGSRGMALERILETK